MNKSDQQLRADVEHELTWAPQLDERHIIVGADAGAVTLTGHVPTYVQRLAAVRAAEAVAGVRAVADDLEVRLAGSDVRDDSDIAESIAQRLAWNSSLSKEDIKAEVKDGRVVLRGHVTWDYQRREAKRMARDLIGVREVVNMLDVRPRPVAKDVQREIAKAFGRQASLDAHGVHINVRDSTAVLTGAVHSLAEQRLARAAAYEADGIVNVESHLVVTP